MRRGALPAGLLLLALLPARAVAEIVDRIVATVGKQVITLSDVQEAYRFERLVDHQPLEPLDAGRIREVALRLVDQILVEKEMATAAAGSPPSVPRAEVERRLAEIKKGFARNGDFRLALQRYGLDEQRVLRRLELHANLERFIEARFRAGILVDEPAIERYYREKLLPELRARGVSEIPPLDQVRDQIEEILVQERINNESAIWLKDLRGQEQIRFR